MRTYTYKSKPEEQRPLLPSARHPAPGLSLLFATLCIVDIFGVFPVIALPRAIVQCGLLGVPLVLVVFALQIYTASLLGKSWNIARSLDPNITRKSRYPLTAVTELTLGKGASSCVSVLLDLTIFAGGIPNLLVASQNLQLFGLKVSDMQFNLSFCYWLLLVGVLLCPIMWLGSPRDMKSIVAISSATISVTSLLIWWSIFSDDASDSYTPVPSSPAWERFIAGYGMLAFQFDVHPTLMTIQVDMKKPKHIGKAVMLGFLISGMLFAVTTALAVWRYGGDTSANILQVMPPGPIVQAAVLISALQLCLTSAIGHSALFQHIEDHLQIQRSFSWRRCLLRSSIVALGVALGESVPRFDIVMSLIGGTLTGPLVFVLPPLMYSRARAMRRTTIRRSSAPDDLCRAGLDPDTRYRSTPAPYTKPERCIRASTDIFRDPRAHSKSTHYSFRNESEYRDNGYSFVYYDSEDQIEINPSTGMEVSIKSFEGGFPKLDGKDIPRTGSLPMMLDATRPSLQRPMRQQLLPDAHLKPGNKIFTQERLLDWIGYCIIVIGILITISSTYINVQNTITFVQFVPPCIMNVSVFVPGLD
ncbi:hypothetical protein TKK_0001010 [Trichogramma kaykai]